MWTRKYFIKQESYSVNTCLIRNLYHVITEQFQTSKVIFMLMDYTVEVYCCWVQPL